MIYYLYDGSYAGFLTCVFERFERRDQQVFPVVENEYIPRFLYVLNSRYQYYENIPYPDRGAEGPDKSWFSLACKNASYFGYNQAIVRELETIAGENNW